MTTIQEAMGKTIVLLLLCTICHSEWQSGDCIIESIETSDCNLGTGDFYKYTLSAEGCNDTCIYDDSNGKTDCEYFSTHEIGDTRPCWKWFDDGVCTECDCENCDDDSRGDKPPTSEPTQAPS